LKLPEQIAKHFRDCYFGGNWTDSSLKVLVADINWKEATKQVHAFNTIAVLVYHMNYFVRAMIDVLEGRPLTAHDKFSFTHPPVNKEGDWQNLLSATWTDVEKCASLVEKLPEEKLWEVFSDARYGNYYRNAHGIIEHTHYHLGQIALIRKLIKQEAIG
jgi:hypothetical protein